MSSISSISVSFLGDVAPHDEACPEAGKGACVAEQEKRRGPDGQQRAVRRGDPAQRVGCATWEPTADARLPVREHVLDNKHPDEGDADREGFLAQERADRDTDDTAESRRSDTTE